MVVYSEEILRQMDRYYVTDEAFHTQALNIEVDMTAVIILCKVVVAIIMRTSVSVMIID